MIEVKQWNGKRIEAPGIYAGIPIERYHGDICVGPSISSSGLRKIMTSSPAHFWDTSIYNKDRAEEEESKFLLIGRMAHHLLFGEKGFEKLFILQPEKTPDGDPWHGSRSYCKAWKAKQKAAGLSIYTKAMLEQVKRMAVSLQKEPLVQAGILNGYIELSWFWKDAETGIWLKTRPDANPIDSMDFADLKTTSAIDFNSIRTAIGPRGYGYYQQGALMEMAVNAILKNTLSSFSFVFIESDRPHCVETVTLHPEAVELGIKANRLALKKFAHGLKTGEWPGPSGGRRDARYIGLGTYDRDNLVDSLKDGGAFD